MKLRLLKEKLPTFDVEVRTHVLCGFCYHMGEDLKCAPHHKDYVSPGRNTEPDGFDHVFQFYCYACLNVMCSFAKNVASISNKQLTNKRLINCLKSLNWRG